VKHSPLLPKNILKICGIAAPIIGETRETEFIQKIRFAHSPCLTGEFRTYLKKLIFFLDESLKATCQKGQVLFMKRMWYKTVEIHNEA
jgi:hypothetical protein